MARMYPDSYEPGINRGEELIFDRLKNDKDTNDWVVFHSLDIPEHIRQNI